MQLLEMENSRYARQLVLLIGKRNSAATLFVDGKELAQFDAL